MYIERGRGCEIGRGGGGKVNPVRIPTCVLLFTTNHTFPPSILLSVHTTSLPLFTPPLSRSRRLLHRNVGRARPAHRYASRRGCRLPRYAQDTTGEDMYIYRKRERKREGKIDMYMYIGLTRLPQYAQDVAGEGIYLYVYNVYIYCHSSRCCITMFPISSLLRPSPRLPSAAIRQRHYW